MDWRAEAVRVVRAFDEALGRPPFPQYSSSELLGKATAVQSVIEHTVDAGKIKMLEGVTEVTTTLPILCASLKEGSPDRKPCLALYKPLLLAVGLASALSTYPISHILADAKMVLGTSLYDNDASPVPKQQRGADGTVNTVSDNEATLFRFMATTHTLTPEDMRRFLRLSSQQTSSQPNAANSSGKGGNKPKGKGQRRPALSLTANKDGAKVGGATTTTVETTARKGCVVPRGVLVAMIDAPLAADCRQVFESFFDNTQKFLDVVGSDGDLASRILAVYGAHIVPKLKLSSLLPCLDASLLDYYVDIVSASLQTDNSMTLLRSQELREIPLRLWDAARIEELARAVATRPVRSNEGTASMLVYTFLYQIFCDLVGRGRAAANISPLTKRKGEKQDASVCITEYLFVLSIVRAAQSVLQVERKTKSTVASPVYASTKMGIISVPTTDVSTWLEPLQVFVQLLLSRSVAVSLLTSGLWFDESFDTEGAASVDGIVKTMELLEATLCASLRAFTETAPKAEQHTSRPANQQSSRTKGKHCDNTRSKKGITNSNNCKSNGTESTDEVDVEVPLVPLSELLSSSCAILLFSSFLRRSVSLTKEIQNDLNDHAYDTGLLVVVMRSYTYLLQHQPQRLNANLWQNFICFFTYSVGIQLLGNREPTEGEREASELRPGNLLPMDALTEVLTSATTSTDSMAWLSPFVLSPDPTTAISTPPVDLTALLSTNVQLWLAVVQAAVNVQNASLLPLSPLGQQLFPAPPAYILGLFCAAVDGTVLQTLADVIVACPSNRSTLLIASLKQLYQRGDIWESGSSSLMSSSFFQQCAPPATVPQSGLKRLLDVVEVLQAGYLAVQHAAEAEAKEAARRAMEEQLRQSNQLAAAHREFLAVMQLKHAAKAAEQDTIQAEVARRRAQAAARFHEDAATRARKRQSALEALQAKAAKNRAEREAARHERFLAYQQRLQSEYRVATFLEHLNLSSARVMKTQDALRKVIDTITPDDLLEFLVSGEAKVPPDMMDIYEEGEVGDGELNGNARENDLSALAGTRETAPKTQRRPAAVGPHHVGEHRDFWAEIMDNPVPVEPVALSPPSLAFKAPHGDATAAAVAGIPSSSLSYRKHSFHKRVSPLLDLFFYEDGDQFGKVPVVLPTIRLRVAASVWPPTRTRQLGFANLHEAFDRMEQRGLVEVRNGVAQLTLLGFRYHFPFHDPDGMLEVYLRESRERVRALMAQRKRQAAAEGEDAVQDVNVGDEEEFDGESDDEDENDKNGGRLLPEVEFGI